MVLKDSELDLLRRKSCHDNAPNGGWGWVVTFSGFMASLILDGISYSFGIFFPELLDYFDDSRTLTSLVISVFNGTYLGIGPLTSILLSIFGVREVSLVGAVIAATALFLCTFSPSIRVMILSFGLCGGFGFGLLYLPVIVTVGQYFTTKRALATGIVLSGSGVGGFVLAPLVRFLIGNYGWKGAMWILSGLALNRIPLGLLLRPLPDAEIPLIYRLWRRKPGDVEMKNNNNKNSNKNNNNNNKDVDTLKNNDNIIDINNSNDDVNKNNNNNDKYKDSNNIDNNDSIININNTNNYNITKNSKKRKDFDSTHSNNNNDNFFDNNNNKDSINDNNNDNNARNNNVTRVVNYNQSRCEDETGFSGDIKGDGPRERICSIDRIFNFQLLKSVTFLLYGSTCFLCMLGFYVPIVFIPDLVQSMGMTSTQAAILISITGAFNTAGRIGAGWAADRPWTDPIVLNSSFLIVGGAATLFVPYYSVFGGMVAYCAIFGLSIAVFVSLRSIIMTELLGIEKLSSSLGLVTLFQGTATFLGAPIGGALTDATGNYRSAFIMAGIAFIASGLLCIPLRKIRNWEHRDGDASSIEDDLESIRENDIYTIACVTDETECCQTARL